MNCKEFKPAPVKWEYPELTQLWKGSICWRQSWTKNRVLAALISQTNTRYNHAKRSGKSHYTILLGENQGGNMIKKEILLDLEEPLDRLSCGVNAMGLMVLGLAQAHEPYANGLHAVWDYLREAELDVQKVLAEIVE